MAVLENSFIVEISSIDKKLKAYLKKLYRIYEKTNDEDQIEEYLIPPLFPFSHPFILVL